MMCLRRNRNWQKVHGNGELQLESERIYNLCSSSKSLIQQALRGRIVAVDILLPSTSGWGFPHRIYGAYAPWDPGLKASFWGKMTQLCRSSPHGWSLIGDLNATVSPVERANSENRLAYTTFLQETGGKDVWKKYPLHHRLTDWTCQAKESTDGGSIIDRLVTSGNGIIEASVQVASNRMDYIPVTDHRPIVAQVLTYRAGLYLLL